MIVAPELLTGVLLAHEGRLLPVFAPGLTLGARLHVWRPFTLFPEVGILASLGHDREPYGADIFPDAPADATAVACPMPSRDLMYPFSTAPAPTSSFPEAPDCALAPHDVIIVLGCPSDEDGTESGCQAKRAGWAVDLWKAGYSERFITSGAAVYTDEVEADVLAALLVAQGVPADAITLEPQAEHTDQNIYYSSLIIAEQGWESAIVVSSVEHLLYAAACDANCCVRLGRLSTLSWPVGGGDVVQAGHYALTPPAEAVADWECDHLENPQKGMCRHLGARETCAG